MDEKVFESIYLEGLEEKIILQIASETNIPLTEAMGLYYGSRLAKLIETGTYGVQYLDYRILADTVIKEGKSQ